MHTDDVLDAVATGLWRWDDDAGAVSYDAEAARLMGLSPVAGSAPEAVARARFHPDDWIEFSNVIKLAIAENTLAESTLRVMDEHGRVLRVVRSRSCPQPVERQGDGEAEGEVRRYHLSGTIQEVPESPPGTSTEPPTASDRRRSHEAFLLDAGRALAEARSTAEVLRVSAQLSMPGFTPTGLAVFAIEGDRLVLIGHHGHVVGEDEPSLEMPLDTGYPAAEAVRTGRAIYLPTPEDYRERFPSAWPMARPYHRTSWAVLPLIVAGRTIGAWQAAFDHPVSFTADERSVLVTIARMLAQALSRASQRETERELSNGLQRSMLPAAKPEIPGLRVTARYVPTGGGLQVGGDWYDTIPLPSGRTALVIGDVQGHDVHAAGVMGQLRVALRAYASEGHHPDAVLSRASRFLSNLAEPEPSDPHEPRFATCLYMEIDPDSGTLDIARAGHLTPLVRFADGTIMLQQTNGGLPLGLDWDTDYPITRVMLSPGDTLLAVTDGLLETGGHDLVSGWERVQAVFREYASLRARRAAERERKQQDTEDTEETQETEETEGGDGARDERAGQSGGPEGATTGDQAADEHPPDRRPAGERGQSAEANSVAPVEASAAGGFQMSTAGAVQAVGSHRGDELETLADSLLQAVHGPPSHHTTGALADRREDDIALLLVELETTHTVRNAGRQAVMTVAQAEPDRLATARKQLRDMLQDWNSEEQVESAVLMLSEMVTNVLLHTDGDAMVSAQVSGETGRRKLRLDVADNSDILPHRRRPGELASAGRGLMLLETLADEWGVDPSGDGKNIWFTLSETPATADPEPSDPAEAPDGSGNGVEGSLDEATAAVQRAFEAADAASEARDAPEPGTDRPAT